MTIVFAIFATVAFAILAFVVLWLICILGKDPDGKEDQREYWEALQEKRWREEHEDRK